MSSAERLGLVSSFSNGARCVYSCFSGRLSWCRGKSRRELSHKEANQDNRWRRSLSPMHSFVHRDSQKLCPSTFLSVNPTTDISMSRWPSRMESNSRFSLLAALILKAYSLTSSSGRVRSVAKILLCKKGLHSYRAEGKDRCEYPSIHLWMPIQQD
ncbi:hypothetical protein M9H77_00131 [Catharanthus roseus]|nr:hypothetical protein M9H77_00131 [Catharanthus roseus]